MSETTLTSTKPSLVVRLEKWMPGLQAARSYNRAWLGKDLVAGIVLSALLVPQGMAYAELAGLPAITGLYTTVLCLFAYAIFGPSPYLVLGPDSSLGPMCQCAPYNVPGSCTNDVPPSCSNNVPPSLWE